MKIRVTYMIEIVVEAENEDEYQDKLGAQETTLRAMGYKVEVEEEEDISE
jgi:hypothetical protein